MRHVLLLLGALAVPVLGAFEDTENCGEGSSIRQTYAAQVTTFPLELQGEAFCNNEYIELACPATCPPQPAWTDKTYRCSNDDAALTTAVYMYQLIDSATAGSSLKCSDSGIQSFCDQPPGAVSLSCPVLCGSVPPECTAQPKPDPTPPTPTPTPTPKPKPHVTARKDPHLTFAHGGRADFRGERGIFNFLSAKNLSLNVAIETADFRWKTRLVHGTRLSAAYWAILVPDGNTITVGYKADKEPSGRRHAIVQVGKQPPLQVTAASPFALADVSVSLSDRALTVVAAKWSATATASAFPFASLNQNKSLLDLAVKPLYDADADPVAPHGLFGQSFDGDDVAVDGATDSARSGEVTTTAQAEGAIEGSMRDYKMESPYATGFKYSRFGAASAKHRDVGLLSGLKRKRAPSTVEATTLPDARPPAVA